MAELSWEARYMLDIVAIDLQHKILIDLTNQLSRTISAGGTNGTAKRTLDELLKYAIFHFDFEERLMAGCNYPSLEEHKAEHVRLLQEFDLVRADIASGQLALNSRVMNFLQGWLTHHIVSCDCSYAPFVKCADAKTAQVGSRNDRSSHSDTN
jgi:hemerythrin